MLLHSAKSVLARDPGRYMYGMTLIEVVMYTALLSVLLTNFVHSSYVISDLQYKTIDAIHESYVQR